VTLLHQGVTSAKILICMLCITFSILTLCLRLLIQVRERPAEGEWWSPGGLGLLGVGGLLGGVGVLGVRGLLGGVGFLGVLDSACLASAACSAASAYLASAACLAVSASAGCRRPARRTRPAWRRRPARRRRRSWRPRPARRRRPLRRRPARRRWRFGGVICDSSPSGADLNQNFDLPVMHHIFRTHTLLASSNSGERETGGR
jgi:hypothetical protein